MAESFRQTRVLQIDTIEVAELSENSMKQSPSGDSVKHIIDVKTKSQGIVLDVSYSKIVSVQVKLVATDLPDVVYYDLKGALLQSILQEKYGNLAANVNQNAIIPFSTVGNLPFNEDCYLQISIVLSEQRQLKFDRVITPTDANSPIVVKQLEENTKEFNSSNYDELFFFTQTPDVNYNHNGRNIHIPQLLLRNVQTITGVSNIKLLPNTDYIFSQEVSDLYLVEWPNS